MSYIEIKNQAYKVSDDGLYILMRNLVGSDQEWHRQCAVPNQSRVLDMRITKTGSTTLEVLLDDNKWWRLNMHGHLVPSPQNDEPRKKKEESSEKKQSTKKTCESLRDFAGRIKSSYDDFRSIDDSSSFEEDANQIGNDFISQQMNMFSNSWERADADMRKLQQIEERRDREIERLRKAEALIKERIHKENVFLQIRSLISHNCLSDVAAEAIASFIDIKTRDGIASVELAIKAYHKSAEEVGSSELFNTYWCEIFYLIASGLRYNEVVMDFIISLFIRKFGENQTEEVEYDETIEGVIDDCYSRHPRKLYRGLNFEKGKYDEQILERLEFLNHNIFSPDDIYHDSMLAFGYNVDAGIFTNKPVQDDWDEVLDGTPFKEENTEDDDEDDEDDDDAGDDDEEDDDDEDEEDEDEDDEDEDDDEEDEEDDDDEDEEDEDEDDDEDDDEDNDEDEYKPDMTSSKSRSALFPELMETFKKEKLVDESIKPKGFFDFSTKNRNRKVESLKDKRRDVQEEIDEIKKDLRKCLISILKLIEKLIKKEKTLAQTKETPIRTNREKERIEDKIESLKDDIESIQDDIKDYNKEVKDFVSDLFSKINKLNGINRELHDLTASDRYVAEYNIQGPAITIAERISQNVKMKDSATLIELFKDYLG